MPLALPTVDDNATMAFVSSTALTASNHEHAVVGMVPKSGTITGVGFRFAAVTKVGSPTLVMSLQDVTLSAGPPGQPDGTQDQTATIATGDVVANTWKTITLGTNRTVTQGDLLAVVWDYGTFTTGDSIAFSHWQTSTGAGPMPQESGASHYNGSTWAILQAIPNIVLAYNDGTFATLTGCSPAESLTSTSFNSGTATNLRGNLWIPHSDMTIRGIVGYYQPSGNADLVIYNSAFTELRSVTIDANTVRSNALRMYQAIFSSDLDVTGGSTYYLMLRPAGTNVTMVTIGVNTAAHLQATFYGDQLYGAYRTSGGTWSTNTAEQNPIGVIQSKIGSTGSGAGGLVIHPGMTGGMRG
jgi:hypothetical protein